MKYVLLTHKRYKTTSVLESTVEYATAPALIAMLPANNEAIDAISAGEPGHHFVEGAEYTYQVVIKTP